MLTALLHLLFEPLSFLQLLPLLLLQLLHLRLLRQSPLQAALFFFFFFSSLMPFLFLFPPLLDEVEPGGPWHPFPNKRASTLLSIVRASFESGSPPDSSLTVMGSPTPPDWGGSGLPLYLGDEASRPVLVTAR